MQGEEGTIDKENTSEEGAIKNETIHSAKRLKDGKGKVVKNGS